MEESQPFSKYCDGRIGHPWANKYELQAKFIPYIQMNSKWIAELNVNHKTIEFSREKKKGKSSGSRVRQRFLDLIPKPQSI